MHDALIAVVALLIGLGAGVAVTRWLTADRTRAIASLTEAGRRVTDYHEQVRSLVDLLRPPQSRGKFGEQQLQLILDTTLPPGCWKRQHTLRSGHPGDRRDHSRRRRRAGAGSCAAVAGGSGGQADGS